MCNNWFSIGGLTVHGYGVMIAIGILAAFFYGEKTAKKNGLSPEIVDSLVFVCLVSGYLGSKITYVLTNWSAFVKEPMRYLGADGWVVYGGIIGGILGAWLYCRIKKVSFLDYLNLLFPAVSLAQGFGRIGCFFAGCCYGKPTESALGVVFPAGSYAPAGVSLIPTQLISSLGDFLLFAILVKIYGQEKTRRETAAWYMILYSLGRFMLEYLRGDEIRGRIGIFSTSQAIALGMAAIGVILLMNVKKKEKTGEKA